MNTGDVDKNNSDEGHVDRDPMINPQKVMVLVLQRKLSLLNRRNQQVQQKELYPKEIKSPLPKKKQQSSRLKGPAHLMSNQSF